MSVPHQIPHPGCSLAPSMCHGSPRLPYQNSTFNSEFFQRSFWVCPSLWQGRQSLESRGCGSPSGVSPRGLAHKWFYPEAGASNTAAGTQVRGDIY